jgi:hypothetical protein
MWWRSRVVDACLLLTLGCSTTSNIRRINGPDVEGDITGGSLESIFADTGSGKDVEIPRDEVASIDYPGNVHANVGVGVLLYGGLNIVVGLPECQERTENQTAYCTGVFLPAALGAGMIVWGLLTEHGQKRAVTDTSRRSRPPSASRARVP